MNKIVLITGASSGIGEACARIFAGNGWNLIITGRRKERLEKLQIELEKRHSINCLALCFDVQERESVEDQISALPPEWKNIDVLINNAGLAIGRDFFQDGLIADWETMIDTNIKGLLYMSKAVLPFMIARKKGHIINMGSAAAKDIYEKGNVYCGSKAAVDAISKGQRIDLLQHGIKVTVVHPGAVETEFSLVRFKGDAATARSIYEGFLPLTGEDVANIIYFSATLPDHVCINDLVISGTQQANAVYINKIKGTS
jgi:NADP-dependent 3-hydroxy acid dehydrogenase YdfG